MDNNENQNPTPSSQPPAQPGTTGGFSSSGQPAPHPLDAVAPPSNPNSTSNPLGSPQMLGSQSSATASDTDETNEKSSPLSSIASGFGSVVGAIFSWVIFPIAVVLILHNFVFQAYHVLGTSMVPTLHDTDYLIISKLGYTQALIERTFGKNDLYLPARGQIIVFRYPKDPTKVFVKRVVGEPGDRVVVKNGTVTVYSKDHPDGFNPDVNYEPKDAQTLIDTDEVVQPGNLFVMGDNRTPGGSYDSREWGELPSSYIIGNAVLRLLPLDQVRIL